MFKGGEKISRACLRHRQNGYTAMHLFSLYSEVFSFKANTPPHIRKLLAYLSSVFVDGCPERESSSSEGEIIDGLFSIPVSSELCSMAKSSMCAGQRILIGGKEIKKSMGTDQHPIIQGYLMNNDPLTMATEAPLYNDRINGFIDVLRITPDWIIEIVDYKPDIPAGLKAGREKITIKQKKIQSQLKRYQSMLCERLDIHESFTRLIYFDHEAAFEVREESVDRD